MAADYSQQPRLLKPCAGAVILGLFCFLSIYPVYDCGLADGDVAEYLNNPVRILNGQLPYRDFWLLFSPGEVYLPALTYQLFGLSINAVLIQNLAINAMLAAVVFLVSWLLIRSHLAVGRRSWSSSAARHAGPRPSPTRKLTCCYASLGPCSWSCCGRANGEGMPSWQAFASGQECAGTSICPCCLSGQQPLSC